MAEDTKRRKGLRPPFRRDDLDAIARAEANMALALRCAGQMIVTWRRIGDPDGVKRVPDWSTVRLSPYAGPVVEVRGFAPSGDEDRGLHCAACPVSDLVPVPDHCFQDRELDAVMWEARR